jgi:hypothetical protein
LAKSEISFNPLESLMWKDVKFMKDDSVQIHVKIPKLELQKENISHFFLFPFTGVALWML